MDMPESYINDFDSEFTAYYFDEMFTVGDDNDVDHPIAIVLRTMWLPDWTGEGDQPGRNISFDALVVPLVVTDDTWDRISSGYGEDVERAPVMVAEMCVSYGAYAHVHRFAAGIRIPSLPEGEQSVEQMLDSMPETTEEDYDRLNEWIRAHGEDIARATAGMIGFPLDQPQNMIGETGWDWLLPHMVDGYTSKTSFSHRA